jgi:hypothetical protein
MISLCPRVSVVQSLFGSGLSGLGVLFRHFDRLSAGRLNTSLCGLRDLTCPDVLSGVVKNVHAFCDHYRNQDVFPARSSFSIVTNSLTVVIPTF